MQPKFEGRLFLQGRNLDLWIWADAKCKPLFFVLCLVALLTGRLYLGDAYEHRR